MTLSCEGGFDAPVLQAWNSQNKLHYFNTATCSCFAAVREMLPPVAPTGLQFERNRHPCMLLARKGCSGCKTACAFKKGLSPLHSHFGHRVCPRSEFVLVRTIILVRFDLQPTKQPWAKAPASWLKAPAKRLKSESLLLRRSQRRRRRRPRLRRRR